MTDVAAAVSRSVDASDGVLEANEGEEVGGVRKVGEVAHDGGVRRVRGRRGGEGDIGQLHGGVGEVGPETCVHGGCGRVGHVGVVQPLAANVGGGFVHSGEEVVASERASGDEAACAGADDAHAGDGGGGRGWSGERGLGSRR